MTAEMNERIRKMVVLGGIGVVFLLSLINFYRNVIKYEGVSLEERISAPETLQLPGQEWAGTSWDDLIVQKDLFSPERGAKEEETEVIEEGEVEEAPEPPPELLLKGIVMNQYGEYIALLQVKGGEGKTFKLSKGEEKQGFLLTDIDPVSVTLLWGDQKVELTLKRVQTIDKR